MCVHDNVFMSMFDGYVRTMWSVFGEETICCTIQRKKDKPKTNQEKAILQLRKSYLFIFFSFFSACAWAWAWDRYRSFFSACMTVISGSSYREFYRKCPQIAPVACQRPLHRYVTVCKIHSRDWPSVDSVRPFLVSNLYWKKSMLIQSCPNHLYKKNWGQLSKNYWPLQGYRADLGKIPIECPIQNSGDQRGGARSPRWSWRSCTPVIWSPDCYVICSVGFFSNPHSCLPVAS